MNHIEFSWDAKDSIHIFAQAWEPEQPPRAVICLVHGLGEHSGRYQHLAAAVNQRGLALSAFDLRGHGRSTGQRGYSPSIDVILEDIDSFLLQTRQRYPAQPVFLYGHSLGANLVMLHALKRHTDCVGTIATGPLLMTAFKPPAWKIPLGRIMAKVRPSFSMSNEVDPRKLSRDKKVVQAYIDDPLVHNRLSAKLGIDMLDSGDWIAEHAAAFPLPILLMHGGADNLTSAQASLEFADHAGNLCTLKIWDGFFHEIHNEPEQREVFNYLLQWIDERLTGG